MEGVGIKGGGNDYRLQFMLEAIDLDLVQLLRDEHRKMNDHC